MSGARYTCALCGRRTAPFAFIGAEAIGPTCARRAGITPAKLKATKGTRLRYVRTAAVRVDDLQGDLFGGEA